MAAAERVPRPLRAALAVASRAIAARVNDDATPPFTVFDDVVEGTRYRLDLVSGSFTLDADGSYVSRATIRVVVDGRSLGDEVSPPQTGRYTLSGSTVVFDPAGNDPDEPNFEAARDGDTLTLTQSDVNPDTGAPIAITIVARR